MADQSREWGMKGGDHVEAVEAKEDYLRLRECEPELDTHIHTYLMLLEKWSPCGPLTSSKPDHLRRDLFYKGVEEFDTSKSIVK